MAKFKKGDEVLVIDSDLHKSRPEYYPAAGSYGTVRGATGDSIAVQYGANSGTAYDHAWGIDDSALHKVTQKDRNRAVRYYTRYAFAPALNDYGYYGSIFTSVSFAYKKSSEAKLQAEQEIKARMTAEGGADYRVLYANCHTFATAYVAENILVIDTKTATYRYDLDFCRNEYTKRALGMKEMQAKVDAALEVCNRG